MFYYIYKTYNPINNKFYIGRHSTNNLDDGYMGSGRWVSSSLKKNNKLEKEIISFFDNEDELLNAEEKLIESVFNDPLCMNMIISSIGFDSQNNPGRIGRTHQIGDNHHMKKKENKIKFSENNPSKRDDVKELRRKRAKELWADEDYRKKFINENHWTYNNAIFSEHMSKNNPMHNKEVALKVSKKLSEKSKLEPYGFHKPEVREKTKLISRSRLIENNPMKDSQVVAKIKSLKRYQVECNHCHKLIRVRNINNPKNKYHFDNCNDKN